MSTNRRGQHINDEPGVHVWIPETNEGETIVGYWGGYFAGGALLEWFAARRAGPEAYAQWRATHIGHLDRHCRLGR